MCDSSPWEPKEGKSRVQGQTGLHTENFSENKHRKQRQEDFNEFEASLICIAVQASLGSTVRPCLKKQTSPVLGAGLEF